MTERTCKTCGETKPREAFVGRSLECKPCKAVRSKAHYYANRVTVLAKIRERRRENWDEYLAYGRAHYKAHPEPVAERIRQDRQQRPEVFAARGKAYREAHPEAVREASHRWHAKRRGADIVEADVTWHTVSARDGMTCTYCQITCDPTDGHYVLDKNDAQRWICGPTYPTVDHVIPVSHGGNHTMANAVLACRRCNQRKSNRREVA